MLLAALVRVEVRRHERPTLLRITMDVGEESQDRRGVIPGGPALGLGHDHEFVEGEGSGVEAEIAGEFPDEAIHRFASASGLTASISFSA